MTADIFYFKNRVYSYLHFFPDQQSSLLSITASVIHGSAAYVVNTGDLIAVAPGNSLCKFAGDTYIIIPATNQASRDIKLTNIQHCRVQLKGIISS